EARSATVASSISAIPPPAANPASPEAPDLTPSTFVPIESPSETEQEASPEAQQSPLLGRRRFISTSLVLGVALLLAFGSAFMGRRAKVTASLRQGSHVSPTLAQITFNDEKNQITAEAVSPKGRLVAYSDRYGVSVHTMDTGTDRLLATPSSFLAKSISWHPSEDWMLVSGFNHTSKKNEAWAVFLHGEAPRLLLDDADLAVVSPGGNQIAFTRADNTEIWIANGIGQSAHLLVPKGDGESLTCLLWSPQSDRLIDDRVIGAGPAELDGPDPAGSHPRSSYESVDVRSGKLLSRQENVRFNSGFLLRDGRFFFPTVGDFSGTRIMVASTDPNTGKFLSQPQPVSPTQVRDAGGDPNLLSASTSGDWIGAVLTSRVSDVYVARVRWPGPTLEEVSRLTDRSANNYPHAWTPNGDSVLFDRNTPPPLIGKQKLGEPKMEVVAQLPNTAAMAAYSTDGKWILFTEFSGSPSRAMGIFSIPSSGGQPRQLHTTGVIDEFHCPISDSGTCVVRETDSQKEFLFFALDPVQGMQQELGRSPWTPTVLGDWSISSDGSTVAMADHDPQNPGIRLIHLSPHRSLPTSTIPVRGFGEVREASWAPGTKGFFVETKTTNGYDLLFVDPVGHAKLLRQSPISIWGIPSREGKRLAFPGQTVASNVWVGRTALP
ncbi:MAG TPA: hypothetical protein VGR71_07745, partial [Nitrospira sp.]|nr:hypothetical protein [Nitrospira sp.]